MNKYRLYEIKYTRNNGSVTSDFYPQTISGYDYDDVPEWTNLYNEDRVLLFHDRVQAIKAIKQYVQKLKYLEELGVKKIVHSYEDVVLRETA